MISEKLQYIMYRAAKDACPHPLGELEAVVSTPDGMVFRWKWFIYGEGTKGYSITIPETQINSAVDPSGMIVGLFENASNSMGFMP